MTPSLSIHEIQGVTKNDPTSKHVITLHPVYVIRQLSNQPISLKLAIISDRWQFDADTVAVSNVNVNIKCEFI